MKKTYETPRLTTHGDIRAMTRGYGGNSAEALYAHKYTGGDGGGGT